jgi:menaquinone-specific isochorismate synthase
MTEQHDDDTIKIRQGAYLPHWTRKDGIYAIRARLADSLPQLALRKIEQERARLKWRMEHAEEVPLGITSIKEFERLHSRKIEQFLHASYGKCWLAQDDIAGMVVSALQFHAGSQYQLIAWSIMPNHLHAVLQPLSGHDLEQVIYSFKSFTAHEANRLLGRKGSFWQKEPFDHLIRDEEDLSYWIEYILQNPEKAHLRNWKWTGCDESWRDRFGKV